MDVDEIVQNTKLEILKRIPDANVYLFGSRLRGKAQKYSDIDIAIDASAEVEANKIQAIREAVQKLNYFLEVQLVDLNFTSEKFKSGVLSYAKKV